MKQFILDREPDRNNAVRLEGDDYRYLVRVRRLAAGEYFPAVLPNGKETLIKILSINKNTLTGQIVEDAVTTASELCGNSSAVNIPPIILFQALPKGDKMDLVVRQAAEGGITEIVPFVSEFSVAKANAAGQKFNRWERIIKEARQQSGSKTATSIRQPLTKNELFDYWKKLNKTAEPPLGLLFHHQGLEQKSLHSYLNSSPSLVVFAVGSEGGFSGEEVKIFLENDFKPFTIGNTILRTETAALYCAASIRILLLERETWELKK